MNIKEAIADRGYGAIDNIKSLNRNSITTYIPLFSTRSGKKALEMKENLKKSIVIMGFSPDTDMNVLFSSMTKTIESLKKHIDT